MPSPCTKSLCIALSVVSFTSAAARAEIVYSGVRNLVIPNTGTGLMLNVVNGTTYTGPNFFPTPPEPGSDWDINPFGSTAWGFFVPNNGGQSPPIPVPSSQKGYVSSSPTGQVVNLAPGTIIGPGSTFNVQGPDADTIANGQPAIVGFRFRNEANDPDTAHYGWVRLRLSNGQPGTLVDYAWESTPGGTIAAGAIPEPGAVALFAVAPLAALRRRRGPSPR